MRKFLVVVDETEECKKSLLYASIRAQKTGSGLVIAAFIKDNDPSQWLSVGEVIYQEKKDELLHKIDFLITEIKKDIDIDIEIEILQGDELEQIKKLVEKKPEIAILVLAAADNDQSADPIITKIVTKKSEIQLPITIIPSNTNVKKLASI